MYKYNCSFCSVNHYHSNGSDQIFVKNKFKKMKIILAILICATGMTMSSAYVVSSLVSVGGNEIPTIYNDINDYIDSNPDVKLIPMNIVSNGYNASRSYSLGTRQTGKCTQLSFHPSLSF